MKDEPALEDLSRSHPEKSLRAFCETYLSPWFNQPWWSSQLAMIRGLEGTILRGVSREEEMERGKGATTLIMAAAIWALACRRRRRVLLITDCLERSTHLGWAIEDAIRCNPLLNRDLQFGLHARDSRRLQCTVGNELGDVIFGSLTAMPRTPCDLQLVDNAVNYNRSPATVARCEKYLSRIYRSTPTFVVRSVETPPG